MFKKVHRESTLSDMVSEQIQNLIIDNQLQLGDRLPAERELAQQLGVSRTVVREAVRGLAAKGLLQVSPGRGGTTVRRPAADSITESFSLYFRNGPSMNHEKLLEVRRALEVEIAGLAAERRTDEDLQSLADSLCETEQIGPDDREAFVRCDMAFHAALARATHNELWSVLLDSVADLMIETRRSGFSVPGTAARAYRYHQAIYQQIEEGNAEGARNAMRQHLAEAEDTQRKVTRLRATARI
jgi:GntR family transcriptional repressor for pyruvate dehydrogenase complex